MPDRQDRDDEALRSLTRQAREDFAAQRFPGPGWVSPRATRAGERVLDVLIIGGGQGGLAVAARLVLSGVTNLLVVDDRPPGNAGPWRQFARMPALRTPTPLVAGMEHGIPSLSFRAWYSARFGRSSWESTSYVPTHTWADYLDWYREVLDLPISHHIRVGAIDWSACDRCLVVPVAAGSGRPLFARKVVLATGLDGSGRWALPAIIRDGLPSHAYSSASEAIEFEKLRGKRVGVLGCGASGFDNAIAAAEAGAAEVVICARRPHLASSSPFVRIQANAGLLQHFCDLPDRDRWQAIRAVKQRGEPPPRDTIVRANALPAIKVHHGQPWLGVSHQAGRIVVRTPERHFELDHIIVAAGITTDLSARPELRILEPAIARWADRFVPAAEDADPDLLEFPYLGPHFEFVERRPGQVPHVSSVFNFTLGTLLSHGMSGSVIVGLRYGAERLARGIGSQLFLEDREAHLSSISDEGS